MTVRRPLDFRTSNFCESLIVLLGRACQWAESVPTLSLSRSLSFPFPSWSSLVMPTSIQQQQHRVGWQFHEKKQQQQPQQDLQKQKHGQQQLQQDNQTAAKSKNNHFRRRKSCPTNKWVKVKKCLIIIEISSFRRFSLPNWNHNAQRKHSWQPLDVDNASGPTLSGKAWCRIHTNLQVFLFLSI